MSIGAEVASHLPFLRRYARALTGSQTTGDAFVRATLEAALADGELAESLREGRVPLYRAFNKVWSSAYLEVAEERVGQGLHESAAQDQLRKITPLNRQALLLTTVEDFSPAEAARIMDIPEADVSRLVQEAVDEIEQRVGIRDHLLIQPRATDPHRLVMQADQREQFRARRLGER